jgi:hypothetical protein
VVAHHNVAAGRRLNGHAWKLSGRASPFCDVVTRIHHPPPLHSCGLRRFRPWPLAPVLPTAPARLQQRRLRRRLAAAAAVAGGRQITAVRAEACVEAYFCLSLEGSSIVVGGDAGGGDQLALQPSTVSFASWSTDSQPSVVAVTFSTASGGEYWSCSTGVGCRIWHLGFPTEGGGCPPLASARSHTGSSVDQSPDDAATRKLASPASSSAIAGGATRGGLRSRPRGHSSAVWSRAVGCSRYQPRKRAREKITPKG